MAKKQKCFDVVQVREFLGNQKENGYVLLCLDLFEEIDAETDGCCTEYEIDDFASRIGFRVMDILNISCPKCLIIGTGTADQPCVKCRMKHNPVATAKTFKKLKIKFKRSK